MLELCQIILYFFAYSFLGWCCECVYCSIPAGKFINRGFLNGPICPVYGFGALTVLLLLKPVSSNLVLLFLCGTVVTSMLEYLTGWLLETLFHTKWWDYSHYRFQIRGRVCLLNSTLFGLLAVFAERVVHPFVSRRVDALSMVALIWLASSFTTLLAVDCGLSVRTTLQLSGKLALLQNALSEVRERTETAIEQGQLHERLANQLKNHTFLHRRLLDAFPNMQSQRYAASLPALREAIARLRAEKKNRRSSS